MMHTEPARAYRYALYFAPRPDSLWWQAGSHWLGRCAVQQQALTQPDVKDVEAHEFTRLTASPRRYGWHATLKAPFELGEGVTPAALRTALQAVCRRFQPCVIPAMQVSQLDDFLALVPASNLHAIHDIAGACVTELQPLAAPLRPAELQRRRSAGLTPEEDALLLRWSYPYVLEHFRFHISLTGSLQGVMPEVVQALRSAAQQAFDELPMCHFDSVALFAEPTKGADFVLLEHVGLGI